MRTALPQRAIGLVVDGRDAIARNYWGALKVAQEEWMKVKEEWRSGGGVEEEEQEEE